MYSKIRRFNSDISIYEFDPNELIFQLTGEVHRTKLSGIKHNYWENKGKQCYAKTNAGYFGWDEKTNTSGVDYRDEGFIFSDTTDGDEFIELVYQGKRLHLFDGTVEDVIAKYPHAEWSISMGYSLVENGLKSIRKSEKFTHSNQSHPRSMIGQKADGTIILVVADGRSAYNKGLTANEQATVMLQLRCVIAVNGDGGGSSEMIVDDKIVNSITEERKIATAFVVYGPPKEVPIVDSEIKVIGKVAIAPNFNLDEISCRHCGEVKFPDYRLLIIAQAVREHFGKAIRLVGYRCLEHNTNIGGDKNSYHMQGLALDISAWSNDIKPIDIYNYVLTLPGVRRAKYYPGSHIHIQSSWLK